MSTCFSIGAGDLGGDRRPAPRASPRADPTVADVALAVVEGALAPVRHRGRRGQRGRRARRRRPPPRSDRVTASPRWSSVRPRWCGAFDGESPPTWLLRQVALWGRPGPGASNSLAVLAHQHIAQDGLDFSTRLAPARVCCHPERTPIGTSAPLCRLSGTRALGRSGRSCPVSRLARRRHSRPAWPHAGLGCRSPLVAPACAAVRELPRTVWDWAEGAALWTFSPISRRCSWWAAVSATAPILAVLLPGQRVPQLHPAHRRRHPGRPAGPRPGRGRSVELIANVGLGFVFLLAGFEIEPRLMVASPGGSHSLPGRRQPSSQSRSWVGWRQRTTSTRSFLSRWLSRQPHSAPCYPSCVSEACSTARSARTSWRRRGRRAAADPGDRDLPGSQQQYRRVGLPRRHRPGRGAARPSLETCPRSHAGPRRGRRCRLDRPDDTAVVDRPAPGPVGLGGRVRSRRRSRRVPCRCCPSPVGAGRRALAGGKLDAIGYGFFIPVFFVSAGVGVDIESIREAPLRLLVFFVLLLSTRDTDIPRLPRRPGWATATAVDVLHRDESPAHRGPHRDRTRQWHHAA